MIDNNMTEGRQTVKKKRIFMSFFIAISCAVILDFIPIKSAIRCDDFEGVYSYVPKTEGPQILNWVTKIDNCINQIKISGKDPYKVLSNRDFDAIDLYTERGDKTLKFVIYGEYADVPDDEKNFYSRHIVSEGWDIIYPINRLSVRKYYVPKGYLTIYDFDWINVMKEIF